MRVGIPEQHLDDGRVEQLEHLDSLARDTPRAAATASRCAPSGNSPSNNGRHCRGGYGSGRLGSEADRAGAAASASQPAS